VVIGGATLTIAHRAAQAAAGDLSPSLPLCPPPCPARDADVRAARPKAPDRGSGRRPFRSEPISAARGFPCGASSYAAHRLSWDLKRGRCPHLVLDRHGGGSGRHRRFFRDQRRPDDLQPGRAAALLDGYPPTDSDADRQRCLDDSARFQEGLDEYLDLPLAGWRRRRTGAQGGRRFPRLPHDGRSDCTFEGVEVAFPD